MGSIAASETVVVKNMARELFHFSYFILIAPRDTMFGLGQLLWHITTLEALLGEPREVTATLAKRVALITEQTNKARGEVRKQVQELYDFRSSIVHGKTTLRTNRIHEGHLRKARNLSRLEWSTSKSIICIIFARVDFRFLSPNHHRRLNLFPNIFPPSFAHVQTL